ncbi:hypothetical protein MM236_11525 [Belliella sp. DSM 107340]|uniref:O-Antigen ligase n=1 Tax=Belliella calami TaxID=2923436 RepID=A0ABS9UPU0_9BACT|nr:hypothetical protein [Belliella calami]MCH7398626.1 hypothetical protein [Belliella calami]
MGTSEKVENDSSIRQFLSELKFMNLFFIGFILYSIGFTLASTGMVNYLMCSGIQFVGILMFLPSSILLIELKVENNYLKIMVSFYLIYICSIIFRGFVFDFNTIKDLLIDGWFGIFIYLVPVLCLFPKKILLLKKSFDTIYILSVLFLFYVLAFLPVLMERGSQESMGMTEVFSRTLGLTSGFILMTYPYHSLKLKFVSGSVMTFILTMSLYQARRGLMMYCLMIILFAGVLYLMKGHNRAFVVVAILMLISTSFLIGAQILNKSSFFSSIKERGMEDTRSNVEESFYEDMETVDWIIGRGINGQYYCPGIVWDGDSSVYRGIIETDFLQIILKGGLVSLSILLLIFIPAIFLGLFNSNNLLVKAGSIWIMIGLINMYPSTVNTFTLNYILMWVFAGIVYTKKYRMLSDSQIFQQLKDYKTDVS